MILLEDHFEHVKPIFEASEDGNGKKFFLEGVFAESGVKNRNKRIYRKSELAKAVEFINEEARLGTHVLGELNHPDNLVIDLDRVSHRIVEARMVGNQIIAKAEILQNLPEGKIAASYMEHGVRLGVSTRGSGVLNKNTGEVSDFNFVTADIVARPSCRSAYPETLREQLEMYGRGGVVRDLAEAAIHDDGAQEYFKREMMKFINSLRGN